MKQRTWGFVGVVLSSACLAMAGSFDASLVSRDANWVMHIDFSALRASTIGESLLARDVPADVQQQWQRAEQMLGMDLRKDLHAVTMYGSAVGQDDVVVWIQGKLDPGTLASQLENMDGYQRLDHGSHVVHSWVDAPGEMDASRVYGVAVDGGRGVLGPSEALILKALQVMDGTLPNVTDGGISVATLTGSGLLMAATADLRHADLSANPMLAQAGSNARNFRMDIREADGMLGVRMAVQQGSVQDAQQAMEMLNGFKMMGLMQLQQQNPDLAALLQAIAINRNEDTLLLGLSYPSRKLVAMMQEAAVPFVTGP